MQVRNPFRSIACLCAHSCYSFPSDRKSRRPGQDRQATNQALDLFSNDEEKNKHVEKLIKDNFDLSPRGIREMLGLNKPIYEKTAAYGHFGREPESKGAFSWEKTDKASIFSR